MLIHLEFFAIKNRTSILRFGKYKLPLETASNHITYTHNVLPHSKVQQAKVFLTQSMATHIILLDDTFYVTAKKIGKHIANMQLMDATNISSLDSAA